MFGQILYETTIDCVVCSSDQSDSRTVSHDLVSTCMCVYSGVPDSFLIVLLVVWGWGFGSGCIIEEEKLLFGIDASMAYV